ncbi:hypothetical protein XELAEV_18010636mg [Xenopus laevis]|uniref:Uncharacterized protein n=1 Tax=Xenopus laevis TaxID=8355 RepID=A0A974I1Q4_XENLA|nr:hypothetical protein XELAEV_18010636mg [Xenopus laevis]
MAYEGENGDYSAFSSIIMFFTELREGLPGGMALQVFLVLSAALLLTWCPLEIYSEQVQPLLKSPVW